MSRAGGMILDAVAAVLVVASLLTLLPSFVELGRDTCDADGCDGDEKLVQIFREGCPVILSDVECALRMKEEIEKWLKRNNNFRILITGKMGSGKTTLVKGLKDRFVPEADHLEPHTVKVTPHKHEQNKISFVLFDTPGLQDEANGGNDYSYLEDMVRNSDEPHVVIFTLKMDDDFREEDIIAIEKITGAFGWKVWRNAIFVLTFANTIYKEGVSRQSRENHVHYNRIRDEMAQKVTNVLLKNEVQEDVANKIAVIPVGLVSQPFIESDESEKSWIEKFWKAVSKVLKRSELLKSFHRTPEEKLTSDKGQGIFSRLLGIFSA